MDHLLDNVKTALEQPPPSPYVSVPPTQIPQPYRRLLVHDSDMTGTLAAYWRQPIHIRALRVERQADSLYREVVLLAGEDPGARLVEAGAIRIFLAEFPEAAKQEILGNYTPFGGILHQFKIPFVSRPRAYFRAETTGFLREAFPQDASDPHYGRHNVLSTPAGTVLAEVVEILPGLEV